MRGADRISELHDSILTHILSYLTTKEAVQTRRLSKRWRNVWASVPVLDIDFARCEYDECHCHKKFVKFISTVLTSRQVQLVDRFRLVYINNFLPTDYYLPLKLWIPQVAQQCPRVLSIFLQRTLCTNEIPDLIFTCLSLEEIEFHVPNYAWHITLNPTLVTLPHLRKLNLGHFWIKADFMDKLLPGCPSLEELELCACRLDISHISCGSLKSLVINCCSHANEIEVSIPSLQYLKVTVVSSEKGGYIFNNMSSLVKASICLFSFDDSEMPILNREAKILMGLLGVATLDIVLYGLHAKDMLEHILKSCPYFENLKFMHFESFDGCMAGCIDMVTRLVQHAPGLKELTFYRCQDDSDDEIKLVDELREVLGEYGTARLVECNQGCVYGSLSELEELLYEYLNYFESINEEEIASSENEGEEEEDDDGEGSSAEE